MNLEEQIMDVSQIQLIGSRILVEESDNANTISNTGIILPDTNISYKIGIIKSTSSGYYNNSGLYIGTPFVIGQNVIYITPSLPIYFKLNGIKYILLNYQTDVIGSY